MMHEENCGWATDEECECGAIQRQADLWADDEVQFARLICEIVATVDDLRFSELATSMDLSSDELQELFDRADERWERAKREATWRQ